MYFISLAILTLESRHFNPYSDLVLCTEDTVPWGQQWCPGVGGANKNKDITMQKNSFTLVLENDGHT
jgi:hypothetical protein